MGAEEQRIALNDQHPYSVGTNLGYSELIRHGQWLRQNGVSFHDLTRLFADNDEILYSDQCCHLNTRGYDLVVEKILGIIEATLSPSG